MASQVKCGIVGLPNVGKSTLFNALRSAQGKLSLGGGAKTANYPFTTIEPNVGVVEVPDERLQKLAEVVANENSKSETRNPKQIENSNDQNTKEDNPTWPPIVPAVVEFVDIAGLVKGAHKGEGLGNQFLSHIREVDAIVFVVRDFKSEDIIRTGLDPKEDLEVLKSELLLKDLETVEKVLSTRNSKQETINREVLEKAKNLIEQGKWLRGEMTDEELEKISELQFLSSKKTLVVVNSDESDLGYEVPISGAVRICAKMEEELASLSEGEQKEYLAQVEVSEPGVNKLICKAYEVLGLMSFYTAGPKEVRAWTVKRGSLAPAVAGVIHTDFERGFIAADIVAFDEFVEAGGWKGAREKGFVKTIGKSEVMPENSVVEFKFSV